MSLALLHYDALNSVDMITDGYGNTVERRSYDTWGKQRKVAWQSESPLEVMQLAITNRGYTGHEEIVEVGLVHMNGRVYDQELGRFISADPIVQAPFVTNSYNRYAYVWNNPLKYNDPTGFVAVFAVAPTGPIGIASTYNGKQVGLTNEDIDDAKNAFNAFRAGAAFGFAKKLGATDEQAFTFARMVVDPHKALSEISENQAENALDAEDKVEADNEIDSFDKLVESANHIKGSIEAGQAEQYEKEGDPEGAYKEFKGITKPETEVDISRNGRKQKIADDKKDGRKVTYREKTKGKGDYNGPPTISRKNPGGKETKIRYERPKGNSESGRKD